MNHAADAELFGAPGSRTARAPISALRQELGVIHALWLRDTLRLIRERSRWLGLVAQPLMLWGILGAGFADSFHIPGYEDVSSLQYMFPGILGMVLLFTSIFSTMSVIEDRQSGFLQGVLVVPASRASLVLGKTAGVTTIVLVQSALFMLAAPLAGYAWGAVHWGTLLAVILLANTALTCANFVFAWVLNSTQAYHALMSVVLMPLWMISGAMFPPPSGWFGVVVAANPMTYGVAGLRAALGVPAGDAPSLAVSLAVLVGSAGLSLVAAIAATRRR
ncbi:MAG: ABC transporter permease [Myxococcales bacterium]|nr:ABC transporter permease [Myxococcales bacterium]MCB9533057.1 ABC transporter permease [Myxococcales bacterium]